MNRRPLRQPRRVARRAIGLAALACALAALGCNKSPLSWTLDFAPTVSVAGKSAAPGVASPAPASSQAPTPFPTIGTASQAPTQAPATAAPSASASASPTEAPEVSEPIDPDAPLPAASITSDLAPAEQAAVEQALSSEDILPYLGSSDLIHDGGVVLLTHDGGVAFYHTLATGDVKRQAATMPLPPMGPAPIGPAPIGPAPLWGRSEEAHSDTLLTLRKECPSGDCVAGTRDVIATVHYQQKGTFTHKGQAAGTSKRFGALFTRRMRLVPKDGKYQLAAVSPIQFTTNGGRLGLEIERVSIFRQGTFDQGGPPSKALFPADMLLPLGQVPFAIGGERVRLEVDLMNRGPGVPFVFASVPGAAAEKRVQFFDDGRGVDRAPGDRRYSGEVTLPEKDGLQHVLIDVLDPKSFSPEGRFRANTLGLGFRVSVKEGG